MPCANSRRATGMSLPTRPSPPSRRIVGDDRGRDPEAGEVRHVELVDDRPYPARALVSHHDLRLVASRRQLELAHDREPGLPQPLPGGGKEVQLGLLVVAGVLSGLAPGGHQQELDASHVAPVPLLEAQGAHVHLGGQAHPGPAEHALVPHEVGHAEREVHQLVGRIEALLEDRVHPRLAPGGVPRLAMARSSPCGPGRRCPSPRHLDRDLPKLAVASGVGGVVAHEIVAAVLVGDALQSGGEVVGVADGEASAFGGDRLRPLRVPEVLGEGAPRSISCRAAPNSAVIWKGRPLRPSAFTK